MEEFTDKLWKISNGTITMGFRCELIRKYQGIPCSYSMLSMFERYTYTEMKLNAADGSLTANNVSELARDPMCFIWSLCCHPKTDLLDGSMEQFDEAIRPAQESFVLHVWYGYLIVSKV